MNAEEEIKKLLEKSELDFQESFRLIEIVSKIVSEDVAREYIIRVLDKKKTLHRNCIAPLEDLIISAGLYPYSEQKKELHTSSLLRYEVHKSKNLENVYFHEEQLEIADKLLSDTSVILSAPTSFGKSLLIEEIVSSDKYKNIVIIQPTLALLDETRKKLKKYKQYNIILSTKQNPSIEKNIFLFTGERVVEYQSFPLIDFFILDEFYKLSLEREDERAYVLNQAFYKLLKITKRFYLLSPPIESIPKELEQNAGVFWKKTNYNTVVVDETKLDLNTRMTVAEKETYLFQLLSKIENEQTLIYCSSPNKATKLAQNFYYYFNKQVTNKELNKDITNLIEWSDKNIHPDWALSSCLKNKIGFHHGAIPRHIGSSMVQLFNEEKIQFLFCTSTLIEGVNTAAKNVFLFDKKKGRKSIDFFDFQNIKGRSGRMLKHFKGNVYNFHPEPEQLTFNVDIPIISKENDIPELLIHLKDTELSKTQREKVELISDSNEKLLNLFRSNSGIMIEGQKKLIQHIRKDIHSFHTKLNWTWIPSYKNLEEAMMLIWEFLLTNKDNKAGIISPKQLTLFTHQYHTKKNLKPIILECIDSDYYKTLYPDKNSRVNHVVNLVLGIKRHWFDYRLPKLLCALSKLQKFIFEENDLSPGDYSHLAGLIEFSSTNPNYYPLIEYDIPNTVIPTLEKEFGKDITSDQIITKLRAKIHDESINSLNLLEYEKNKIINSLS